MSSVDGLSSVQAAAASAPVRQVRQDPPDTDASTASPPPAPVAQTQPAPQDQTANVIYTALASASASTIRGMSVDAKV